jgi:hypothetical protein
MFWKLALIVAAIWILIRLHARGCVICGLRSSRSYGENPATETGDDDTPLQTGDGSSGTGCVSSIMAQSSYSSAPTPPLVGSVSPLAHYSRMPISNTRRDYYL